MNEHRRVEVQYHRVGMRRKHPALRFFVLWLVDTLSLWVASTLFPAGIAFQDVASLVVSGLLLGLANTFVKPIMLILTLPISVVTFGLFILVVNAAVLLLVAWLVPGFTLSGFWAGVGIALFVSVFSFVINRLLGR
jgi:putative membrane protein